MRVHFSLNLTLDGCYDHRAIAGDAELHAHTARSMARADALLFGRVTYQLMEDAWRQPPGAPVPEDPFVRIIDPARKYVVSDTLDAVDWNAELVRGEDLAATLAGLREAPGDRVFVGGVRLAQALTEQRLIDSYELLVTRTSRATDRTCSAVWRSPSTCGSSTAPSWRPARSCCTTSASR